VPLKKTGQHQFFISWQQVPEAGKKPNGSVLKNREPRTTALPCPKGLKRDWLPHDGPEVLRIESVHPGACCAGVPGPPSGPGGQSVKVGRESLEGWVQQRGVEPVVHPDGGTNQVLLSKPGQHLLEVPGGAGGQMCSGSPQEAEDGCVLKGGGKDGGDGAIHEVANHWLCGGLDHPTDPQQPSQHISLRTDTGDGGGDQFPQAVADQQVGHRGFGQYRPGQEQGVQIGGEGGASQGGKPGGSGNSPQEGEERGEPKVFEDGLQDPMLLKQQGIPTMNGSQGAGLEGAEARKQDPQVLSGRPFHAIPAEQSFSR